MSESAVGLGFDVHPFATEGELWLGGLRFEGEVALAGHSDGDVVCHAVADAFLGAGALGDVGEHFPDTVPETEGISGSDLLGTSIGLLAERERTPVSSRRDEMRARLAEIVGVPLDRVSVKATRPEGLGLTGDGIGCLAIALLR